VTRPSTRVAMPSPPSVTDAYRLVELIASLAVDEHDFVEFFRAPDETLSLTVARWPAGSVDDQQPHTEDEVYYVAAGRGTLTIGDAAVDVMPGSIAFVAAGVEHRFGAITEALEVLVFWSPARHTNSGR